ncbi:hypothetical protein [Streptomyces decoyicus]
MTKDDAGESAAYVDVVVVDGLVQYDQPVLALAVPVDVLAEEQLLLVGLRIVE